MALDRDLHFVADRFANIGDDRQPLLQVFLAEIMPDRPNRADARATPDRPAQRDAELVERPDLHRRNAAAQQLLGQRAGTPFKPGVKILVWAVADAGVVDSNA